MVQPARIRLSCLVALAAWALGGISTLAAQQAQPQTTVTVSKPRIGLALGGGAARGLAHIGVLRWFEEHRIPIDLITGTSMGGLIAGAYASGMTPEEIAQLMRTTDWDAMFVADSPFKYKTFRRKQDKRAYPSQLEFGLKGGFQLPGGLNPGQQVSLLLDQIALPYWDLKSFDDLPTPFRCVATDLRKGDSIVLSKGPLARAMRATMAIPGVFTPVNYDEWLLVDGGTLNNIPADVAREMGAGHVIAVNVGADAVNEKEAESLFALLGRTIDTMMATGTRRALKSADLIIDPDLKGLGSTDWRRSDDLAQRGYAAAEAMADKLTPLALGPEEYERFQAARAARRRTSAPMVQFVDLIGLPPPLSPRVEATIARAFQNQVGATLDSETMRTDILTATGSDRFEFLTYTGTEKDGKTGALIGVRPKSYGPPFLALGLELSNRDSSSFAVSLAGRITTYDVVGPGSELRADLGVGTRQVAAVELFRPTGSKGFFVAPRAYFERTGRNAYLDDEFVAEYRVKRSGIGADFGYTTNQRLEIRGGYDVATVQVRRHVGNPLLPESEGGEKASRLLVTFDGQTSPVVPSRGLFIRGLLRHFDDTPDVVTEVPREPVPANPERFTQGEVAGSWFHRARGEDRFFLGGGAGTSFGETTALNNFRLGGLLRLGAFNADQIVGSNYINLNIGYLKRVGRMPDVVGGNIYIGSWLETGSAWDKWHEKDWRNNVTAGAILESLLGPIFLGGSFNSGHARFYVVIGPLFR
jgi:NTE family protein